MFTYPPSVGTLTGDQYSASVFLNDPRKVQRRIRDITSQRFIAPSIFAGRVETNSGSVLYDVDEGLYSKRGPQAVSPGSKYPKTTSDPGTQAQAVIVKWGLAGPVVDETIKHTSMDAVDRQLWKIGNRIIATVDGVFMTALGAGVSQSIAATASWGTPGTARYMLRDVNRAKAALTKRNQGYMADTLILTDDLLAELTSDDKILAGMPRETVDTPTGTGVILRLSGLRLFPTPNLPAGITAMVVDSRMIGSTAFERIGGPNWSGDPAEGIESKTIREDKTDSWLVMARKPVAPMLQEPNSACIISGT